MQNYKHQSKRLQRDDQSITLILITQEFIIQLRGQWKYDVKGYSIEPINWSLPL